MTTTRKPSSSPSKVPPKSTTAKTIPVKRKPAVKKKPVPVKKTFGIKWIVILFAALIVLSPIYYQYILRGGAMVWHWISDIGEDPNYRNYKDFNIHVAEKYTIHGIDVSYAQGKIDWPKVKAMEEDGLHISFVFVKATEGKDFTDSYFQRNWREAAKVGLICGAYHYFRPESNGKEQARYFLKTVKLEKGDMPLIVDVETLDGLSAAQMRESLNDFIAQIYHTTHVKPIIYSGLSFYQDYLEGYYEGYTLWIAHYNKPELKLKPATNWWFWQHSDKAKVNGINHTVDFDTFKGDSVAFRQMLIH